MLTLPRGLALLLSVVTFGATIVAAAPADGANHRALSQRSAASGHVGPFSTLTAQDASGEVAFGPVAVSAATVAGVGTDFNASFDVARVFAFTRTPGGVTSDPATLTPSNGDALGSVAAGADLVVAGDATHGNLPGAEALVFVSPTGGWSGTVHEAAILVGSDSTVSGAPTVAVSGQTVFVLDQAGIDVFTRPSDAWQGTVRPIATLSSSRLGPFTSMSVSENTVIGQTGRGIAVFQMPRTGWRTTRRAAAILAPTYADLITYGGLGTTAKISGNVIADAAPSFDRNQRDAAYVFIRPRHGWASTKRQSATLLFPRDPEAIGPVLTVSSGTVAIELMGTGVNEHQCPCTGSISVYRPSSGGWHGRIILRQSTVTPPLELGPDLSLGQGLLALGGLNGIYVSSITG